MPQISETVRLCCTQVVPVPTQAVLVKHPARPLPTSMVLLAQEVAQNATLVGANCLSTIAPAETWTEKAGHYQCLSHLDYGKNATVEGVLCHEFGVSSIENWYFVGLTPVQLSLYSKSRIDNSKKLSSLRSEQVQRNCRCNKQS